MDLEEIARRKTCEAIPNEKNKRNELKIIFCTSKKGELICCNI